ncbi:WhiB family transcriptional regulator [Georgenia sp. SYP-B2076]|uniref:WhiB family transcriptional regulator n=1 Tax=Georgenia sp. SYP-B2076 TaxID=2495881 RepID=UPI000F8CE774|nr:WhiB family transcriptional regulator [Georgenia sp. SYP-B2076]
MLADQSWAAQAACAQTEPDALFVRGAAQRSARAVCSACPVRAECLADALDSATEFGVWGGLTERERRALLRRYPQVDDWATWLGQQNEEVDAVLLGGRTGRRSAVTA